MTCGRQFVQALCRSQLSSHVRGHLGMVPILLLTQKGCLQIPTLLVAVKSVQPSLRFCVCDPYGALLFLWSNIWSARIVGWCDVEAHLESRLGYFETGGWTHCQCANGTRVKFKGLLLLSTSTVNFSMFVVSGKPLRSWVIFMAVAVASWCVFGESSACLCASWSKPF